MLEEVLNKYFNKKNLKHAYLLETSDFNKVLTVAKKILLDSNEATYNLENLIDNDIYSDLKIITPEGQWIKKEQIIMLKDEFKVKSSYNNKRIYIIKNAEHLNKSSANTMLKFLEEPEENIVALLVTTNKTKVLQTIASRCQYIILDSNKDKLTHVNELILQPNNNEETVRIWLVNNGYDIDNEIIVFEDGVYYEVIKGVKREIERRYTKEELYFGPILLASKNENFITKWSKYRDYLNSVLNKIENKELSNYKMLSGLVR